MFLCDFEVCVISGEVWADESWGKAVLVSNYTSSPIKWVHIVKQTAP